MLNNVKTGILMIALTALLVLVGAGLERYAHFRGAMMMFFILAIGMNLIQYWFSDKIVLGLYKAQEIKPNELPELHQIVERLSVRASIPKPRVYLVPTPMPNAFATGRNPKHAAVAVTQGILNTLDWDELEGVLAHEIGHIRNRDTLISTIAAMMAGTIMMVAYMARWSLFLFGARSDDRDGGAIGMLALVILAPLAAILIQMAISRTREYKADRTGARLSGKPLSLAQALANIHRSVRARPVETSPVTAHLFIINPLKGRSFLTLFSTHPPVEERIKRLETLARRPMSLS